MILLGGDGGLGRVQGGDALSGANDERSVQRERRECRSVSLVSVNFWSKRHGAQGCHSPDFAPLSMAGDAPHLTVSL